MVLAQDYKEIGIEIVEIILGGPFGKTKKLSR